MPRDLALLLLVDLVAEVRPGTTVVVPVSSPSAVEAIVETRGGRAIRSQRTSSAILRAAVDAGATFAGTEDGLYVFPDLIASPDAVAAFCKIHELIARTDLPLAERLDALPSAHVVHREVATPWDRKGTVMRHVAAENRADRTDETEGLKLYHGKDWALVIPDPEDPVTHVWAEGGSGGESERIADRYMTMIADALENA
jgi:mannose-1-phosphate guanylyltransferase/phosphomannomutase